MAYLVLLIAFLCDRPSVASQSPLYWFILADLPPPGVIKCQDGVAPFARWSCAGPVRYRDKLHSKVAVSSARGLIHFITFYLVN